MDAGRSTEFDEFGFAILGAAASIENERCHLYTAKRKFWAVELTAWQKLLSTWDVSKLRGSSKVTKFVERGVPPALRGQLWKKLLDVDIIKATIAINYKSEQAQVREQLVDLGVSEYGGEKVLDRFAEVESEEYKIKYKHISLDALRHIFLDLDRSFPTHELFMGETAKAKEGRAALFRVLAAYARYNPTVEYCQGMSIIAAMFLMQLDCDEESAFWCMVSLLERHKYMMGYFHSNMTRLQEHAEVFSKLLQTRIPDVHAHLEKHEIHPLMYITPWFMALFTGLQCWDSVLSCWDLLLLHGHSALFRISLAMMQESRHSILATNDLCYLLPQLLHPPISVCKHAVLMSSVYNTVLEDWEISSLHAIIEEEKSKSDAAQSHATEGKAFKPNSRPQKALNVDRPRRIGLRNRIRNENSLGKLKSTLRSVQSPSKIIQRRSLRISSAQISPCKEALDEIRRSPRLAPGRALRVVNESLEKRLSLHGAGNQHAFKSFHTPKPLSKHHLSTATPPFVASPDVEMRLMN